MSYHFTSGNMNRLLKDGCSHMATALRDFFKRPKSRTVKFDKETKDDYETKFERAKVAGTTVVNDIKADPFAFLHKLTDDELIVRLDAAKGKERALIKEILKTREAVK